MAKVRSPNYPNHDLEAALGLTQKLYAKDGRNKVSRLGIATHLGHDALSGPALGKLGALRAYGLIEGTGDELRVTEDAVTALMAPEGSDAKLEAVRRLALNPAIFQDIRKEFAGPVSVETLTFWLIKTGFSPSAASIAARAYLETMKFAGALEAGYDSPVAMPAEPKKEAMAATHTAAYSQKQQEPKVMAGERELITGMLSKTAGFRLVVTGSIGAKEIDRLIAKLELDKEILAEPDASEGAADAVHVDDLSGFRRKG